MKRHNSATLNDPVPSKICGGPCAAKLPLTDFPVNRSRSDGRHLYCKTCTRAIVAASRQRNRPYMQAQKEKRRKAAQPLKPTGKKPKAPPAPVEMRIMAAVHDGATTLAAIRRRASVSPALIDGLLADMVLNRRMLATKTVGQVRHYYRL